MPVLGLRPAPSYKSALVDNRKSNRSLTFHGVMDALVLGFLIPVAFGVITACVVIRLMGG